MTKHNFKLSLHQALTLTGSVAAEPTLLDRLEDIRHSVLPQLVIRKEVAVVWPATPQSDPCTTNVQISSALTKHRATSAILLALLFQSLHDLLQILQRLRSLVNAPRQVSKRVPPRLPRVPRRTRRRRRRGRRSSRDVLVCTHNLQRCRSLLLWRLDITRAFLRRGLARALLARFLDRERLPRSMTKNSSALLFRHGNPLFLQHKHNQKNSRLFKISKGHFYQKKKIHF